MQQFAGRRIVDESLPGQLDHFLFFAPGVPHREPDLRSGFSREQLAEFGNGFLVNSVSFTFTMVSPGGRPARDPGYPGRSSVTRTMPSAAE